MSMLMARAPHEHLDRLRAFFQKLESAIEGTPYEDDETVMMYPKDDESLAKLIRREWNAVWNLWERILIGYEMLIENCCDQTVSHLAWRKDIEAALVAAGIEKESS